MSVQQKAARLLAKCSQCDLILGPEWNCVWNLVTKESQRFVFKWILYMESLPLMLLLSSPLSSFLLFPFLCSAFGTWSQRVRFKSSEPTVDSSLVIMGTEVSDEGDYICHISTFPSGNFEMEMSVTVWSESHPLKQTHGLCTYT